MCIEPALLILTLWSIKYRTPMERPYFSRLPYKQKFTKLAPQSQKTSKSRSLWKWFVARDLWRLKPNQFWLYLKWEWSPRSFHHNLDSTSTSTWEFKILLQHPIWSWSWSWTQIITSWMVKKPHGLVWEVVCCICGLLTLTFGWIESSL